jgi:hypothetical protein
VAAACVVAGAIPTPAAAHGQHRLKLRPFSPTAAESIRLFQSLAPDRVRATVANARAAKRLQATAATTSFRAADGVSIPVAVSTAYTPDPAVERSYVTFLGGLVHGSELSKIIGYIATPGQIANDFCGEGALACYASTVTTSS